jgi:quercetin dioxygenase-like cupin family protein
MNTPAAKVIRLDAEGKDYLPLLSGPPESVSMRSGLVVLAPGTSVGRHTTALNEEILVVLEGEGEFRITEGPILPVAGGSALYCPPRREHDVVNTGTGELRYVYVVARAEP